MTTLYKYQHTCNERKEVEIQTNSLPATDGETKEFEKMPTEGFAHHLVGMHTHLHAPDWRTLGGTHAAALGRPPFGAHGAPFFHHQPAAFPAHVGSLERPGLSRLSDAHHLNQLTQLTVHGTPHSTTSPE
ncbi:hypothetical protein DOY81_010411, partial [Sarcophaga bullata]